MPAMQGAPLMISHDIEIPGAIKFGSFILIPLLRTRCCYDVTYPQERLICGSYGGFFAVQDLVKVQQRGTPAARTLPRIVGNTGAIRAEIRAAQW